MTSDVDAGGNTLARANQGCRPGYVWVKFPDRAVKQVLSPRINNEAIGISVEISYDTHEKEDVVTGIAAIRTLATNGESALALGVPANIAAVQNPMIPGERIMPGAPVKAASGNLYVRVLPFRQRNGAWWDGNTTLQLTPTATTGKHSLVLWGIDPRSSTLVQALGADRDLWEILIPDNPTIDPLDLSDLDMVIRAYPDIDWKGVTALQNGATEVDPRKIIRVDHFGYAPPLTNYSASAAPTITDDIDAGYSVGSVWFDGADIYDCTDNSASAAVWALRGDSTVENFTDLTDAPSDYTGEAGKFVRVNGTEDGLEFAIGSASIEVSDGTVEVDPASKLTFDPADFQVTDAGGGEAQIEFIGSASAAIAVEDSITSVSPVSAIEFISGATVTDAGGGIAQVAISGGGGTLNVTKKTMQTRTVLHDETLVSNGAFDVSSIDQTYDYLELMVIVRSSLNATDDTLYMTFNNDTTDANYRYGFGTGGSSNASSVGNTRRIGEVVASGAIIANTWQVLRVFIPFYTSTSRIKTALSMAGWRRTSTVMHTQENALNWNNTAAINRIAFTTDNHPTDLLLAGSRLQIVGVKTEDVVVDVTLT